MLNEIEEDDPIYMAIDRGGGQTCDIQGVVRELDKAGYTIIKKNFPGYIFIQHKNC